MILRLRISFIWIPSSGLSRFRYSRDHLVITYIVSVVLSFITTWWYKNEVKEC